MSLEEIFSLLSHINSLSFSEFEIEVKDLKLKLKRQINEDSYNHAILHTNQTNTYEPVKDHNKSRVTTPISGVYYESQTPDTSPYVKINDKVTTGDTLCIIEAMKTMIEIKAQHSYIIKEILIKSGDFVEELQDLFICEEIN